MVVGAALWVSLQLYQPSVDDLTIVLGYWTFDGTKWENVDIVQGIYDIAVRVLKNTRQIWLFKARDVKILEEPLSVIESMLY